MCIYIFTYINTIDKNPNEMKRAKRITRKKKEEEDEEEGKRKKQRRRRSSVGKIIYKRFACVVDR